jgi:hypothetical protein
MVVAQSGTLEPGALVGGVLLVLAGLWVGRIAVRSLGRLVTMVGTETRAVEAVEPGTVEVEGTVAPAGGEVESGLEDETAVIVEHRTQTEQRQQYANEQSNSLPRIPLPQQLTPNALNSVSAVPFYVEDDTGRVLVDGARADTSLDADAKDRERVGHQRREYSVEGRLEPGDDVYVLGQAIPAEEYTPPKRDGLLTKLLSLFGVSPTQVPASEAIDGEDLVITRDGENAEFLVSDTAEWRGWIRQVAMAVLWTVIALALVGGGVYFVLTGAGVDVAGALGL